MISYICTYCSTIFELAVNERLECPFCGSIEVKRADDYFDESNKYKEFLERAKYSDFFKHFFKNEMRVEIKIVNDGGGRLNISFFDKRYMERARNSAEAQFKEEINELSSLVAEIMGEYVQRIGLRELLYQYKGHQNTLIVRQEIKHEIIKRLQMSFGTHFAERIRAKIMKKFGVSKYEG